MILSRTLLNRTPLVVPHKAELAACAFASQGYGTMTRLARQFDVSRPTVYAARQTAQAVLDEHFRQAELPECTLDIDERHLERVVIALRVDGTNSIRAIETLIPTLLPGTHLSYGKIQEILVKAERRAATYNAQVDLSKIHAGALDEMFSQGDPVLAGVDLDSGCLFLLQRRDGRSGEDWAYVLKEAKAQGLDLKIVVKDAALGIAAGVSEVFPAAQQRDDCFHALYEMGQLRHTLEQRAYGAIAREHEAQERLEGVRRTGRGDRAYCVAMLVNARKACSRAIELHDTFESTVRDATEALQFVDLATATVRSAAQMESCLRAAATRMMTIDDEHCRKVGKYILNRAPGLALYMNDLNDALTQLAAQYGDTRTRLACVFARLRHDLCQRLRPWTRTRDEQHMLGSLAILRDIAPDTWEPLLGAVDQILIKRHRASSAIEGFNAALRPFLYVHKCVTDGFLQLFRAHYNLRTRRWGKHQGTSAIECLTGQKVGDWLSALGYPPSSPLN